MPSNEVYRPPHVLGYKPPVVALPYRKLQRIIEKEEPTSPNAVEAYFALGYMYENATNGVTKPDLKSASVNYETAALGGHTQAAYFLACMHLEGRGVPENFDEGAKWYR